MANRKTKQFMLQKNKCKVINQKGLGYGDAIIKVLMPLKQNILLFLTLMVQKINLFKKI